MIKNHMFRHHVTSYPKVHGYFWLNGAKTLSVHPSSQTARNVWNFYGAKTLLVHPGSQTFVNSYMFSIYSYGTIVSLIGIPRQWLNLTHWVQGNKYGLMVLSLSKHIPLHRITSDKYVYTQYFTIFLFISALVLAE